MRHTRGRHGVHLTLGVSSQPPQSSLERAADALLLEEAAGRLGATVE
jgi:hypothetical protein